METVWIRRGLVVLSLVSLATLPARAETNELAAVIQSDGTVSVSGQVDVPACGMTGKWTELLGKSSDQHLSRHFMFLIPKQAPAMELYLTRDRSGAKPDGAFEIGLVGGYVKGFAGKAGFKAEEVVFADCTIGTVPAKRCQVKLTRDQRSLWVYAYVFVRPTSLTFVTVRPDPDARQSIEHYLATVQFH